MHGSLAPTPVPKFMANERQAPQSDIKQLISKGLEQGYLTYAEVNDHLPDDIVDPEQIEDIIGMINGMGIEVHEVAPDAETLLITGDSTGNRDVDDTAAEEAAAALTGLDAEGGRTTDPVRDLLVPKMDAASLINWPEMVGTLVDRHNGDAPVCQIGNITPESYDIRGGARMIVMQNLRFRGRVIRHPSEG